MTPNQITMINTCAERVASIRVRDVQFIIGLKQQVQKNPYVTISEKRAAWLADCYKRLVDQGLAAPLGSEEAAA